MIGNTRIVSVDPSIVKFNPSLFQYKKYDTLNGDTGTLNNVNKWNTFASGVFILWKDKKGNLFVVDGHQRLNLAHRLIKCEKSKGPKAINAYVFNQCDSLGKEINTAREIRLLAARKNILESRMDSDPFDIAKVLREAPELEKEIKSEISSYSSLIKNAKVLANLSCNAFTFFSNSDLDPRFVVGLVDLYGDTDKLLYVAKEAQDSGLYNVSDMQLKLIKSMGIKENDISNLFGNSKEYQINIVFILRSRLIISACVLMIERTICFLIYLITCFCFRKLRFIR